MKKISLILLIAALTLWAKPTATQLFSVQTVKAKQISTAQSFTSYGYVKANEANIYEIAPRFGGFVEKVYVKNIYSYVKKREALVAVYSPEVYKAKEDYLNSYRYAQRKSATGMLQSAKTKLQLLGVSNKEIENVIKTKKVSKLTTIYAPSNGYIFTKNIVDGSAFKAGALLYKIIDTSSVWVEAKMFDNQVAKLKGVQSFEINTKTTDTPLQTTKKLLYPSVDPKGAAYTLRLELQNPKNKLVVGQYATIKAKGKKQTYLVLPKTAVIRKDGKFYVFATTEYKGEYEPLEVIVQSLDANRYIITQGLSEGDEVVNNALFMMDSDAQINGLY